WVMCSIDFRIGAFVNVRSQGSREVAAGGESEYADALGIEVPFFGVSAHEAHGALGVLQRRNVVFLAGSFRNAVFNDYASDAVFIQPFGDFRSFQVPREYLVGAAGKNYDSGAHVIFRRWLHDGR